MSEHTVSASGDALPKTRRRRSKPPPVLHVYDRRKIMARAWELARESREETARRAYDASVRVIAGRIIPTKSVEMFLAEIPLDLGAAQKRAWAEAKGLSLRFEQNSAPQNRGAIIVCHGGSLAPLRRRFSRVWPLLIGAACWLNSRFIPARAA